MTDLIEYVVVENAGYIGERDVNTFSNYREAIKWMAMAYGHEDDSDVLHVAIRRDVNGVGEYT